MPEAIGWQIQTKLNFNIKERILKRKFNIELQSQVLV